MNEPTDTINFIEDGWLSHWVLWEDKQFRVITLRNPNRPADHGGHIVVEKRIKGAGAAVKDPYENYVFFAKISVIAAVVQKAVELTGIAPHCNVQFNGNWAWRNSDNSLRGIEEGKRRRAVHLHIYPRISDDPCWGNPAYLATYKEQVIDEIYKDRCFTMEQMERLKEFLEKEISTALQTLKESF